MKQNVGLANTASNCFISQTTYYVYEATNILFTFENRGGVLKQTENRSLQTLLVMVLYQKQHTMFMKKQLLFTFENREDF